MSLLDKILRPTSQTPRPAPHAQQETGTPRSYQSLTASTIKSKLRLQGQWITGFLVGVVILAMLAGLYLDVTARAAITGREIQNLELKITANKRVNADLQTQIATLQSNQVMEQRAKELGFEPLNMGDVEYVVVPGYFPQDTANFVNPVNQPDPIAASPEFKQSLFEWVGEQMKAASTPLTNVQP
jgi:cell division protein FtsL